MTAFSELVAAHLDEAFRLDPLFATSTGVHDHDGRWPDLSDAGRRARLDWIGGWEQRLGALAPADLSTDEMIDRDRLLGVLAILRHELDEQRDDAWDPLSWVYVLGEGLFGLLAREFAPPAARLASLAGRLEGLPALLGDARATIGSVAARPVSRFHTERALLDLPGITLLVDDALALAAAHAAEPDVAALRPRLEAAAEAARRALAAWEAHLRDAVLPSSEGEGRLGRARYEAKLGYTLGDPSLTVEHVLAAAERQLPAIRGEMARLARELWPRYHPDESAPGGDDDLVRAVLDRIGAEHAAPEELLDVCRAALERIEAFCRDRDLVGLAEEPLDIEWTPVFLRGWAQAMLTSPGAFDRGQKAYFHVTPVPDSWAPELRESWLREMNRRMLEVITIHEAVPGHYLQGAYANRAASVVRAVYGDGTFAEGWAVYVTQVMIDAGYNAGDPAFALVHWKYYLRALINAMLDIRIHVFGMTEDEALDLMVGAGFQEEGEARAKYDRARLTSTQLSSYFVGSLGMWELEHDVRRRAAVDSGDPRGADAVPVPAIVGGYPPTPGFSYREHLEGVLGHGNLPLPLLRRAVLGD
ncbi:MAG TPA: DUF885 domain-containing protein [Candidatus Limnocylindrales bacterium]|nr:DUF885 domain-containing protein [Candidatus Limnocylindrales bacterium]